MKMTWYTLHVAVLLLLPTARNELKKPEEERREEWSVQGDKKLCRHCRAKSQKVSTENSPVEREIKGKTARLGWKYKHHLSDLLEDCDWFTQYKKCSILQRKLGNLESQQKYKRKTECGTIDTRSSICCTNKVYRKQYGKSTSCCGKYMFDSSRDKCCRDTAKDKHNVNCCKSLLIDATCYSCKHGIITAHFDVNSSICCEGVIYNFSDVGRDVKCCGNEVHVGNADCVNHKLTTNSGQFTRGYNEEFVRTNLSTVNHALHKNPVPIEIDFKEQPEKEGIPGTSLKDTGRMPSVALWIATAVVIATVCAVAVFVFRLKRKAMSKHKAAGNHTTDINELRVMILKDPCLEIVAEKETTFVKGNNDGNSLSSIISGQPSIWFETGYMNDFPDGEDHETSIGCLNYGETLNREIYSRASNCMADEPNGFSQSFFASISSKVRSQGTTHEKTDMLNIFGDECTSHMVFDATGCELKDPTVKRDIEEEMMFVKEDNCRYSLSSMKSSISFILSECQSEGHMSDFTDEEYHSANNAYFEQGDTFNHRHHHEIAYHENNVSGGLAKDVSIDSRNLSASIWRDVGSQTMTDKHTKKMNIFGEDWIFNGTFDATGGLLRGEKTSVELIIPQGLLDVFSTSEVYGSVYTKIGALRRKFDLSVNDEIVGPGVEFWFPTRPKFKKYAVVKIPYFGDDNVNVYWFPSDSGSNEKLTLQKLELKSKYNNANQDMYYQIGGDGFVYIYTKHFSGFLCTRCTCDKCPKANTRELTLYGVTFGSYKSLDQRRQVRVRLYIADGKAKLDDFMQEYVSLESSKGREYVDTTEIGLVPDELESEDSLSMRLEVMDDEDGHWIHKKKRSGQPLKLEVQFLQLSKIVRCCRQDDYPAFVEWFLENDNSVSNRTFQCFVDIDVTVTKNRDVITSDITSSCSTIIIEGLLMQKSEEDELKQCEKVRGILAKQLDAETADTFLQELGIDASLKFARERASHGYLENMLLQCQNKYDPGRFLAMTESIIRKLNIPRILEEIGSCYLHECVSGKAAYSSMASSHPVLMEAEGECGGGENYVRAELPLCYPSSTGPAHIPVWSKQKLTNRKHDTVVHPMDHTSVELEGSESDEKETLVLKL